MVVPASERKSTCSPWLAAVPAVFVFYITICMRRCVRTTETYENDERRGQHRVTSNTSNSMVHHHCAALGCAGAQCKTVGRTKPLKNIINVETLFMQRMCSVHGQRECNH